jgi:hypothetical protein
MALVGRLSRGQPFRPKDARHAGRQAHYERTGSGTGGAAQAGAQWRKPLTNDSQGLPVIGAGEMNRTPDLLITNELLYRLSYTGFFRNPKL